MPHVRKYPIYHNDRVTGKSYNKVKIVKLFLRTGVLV